MRRKLGEILLSSGMVAPGDISDALADQNAGEPSRLGDLLVASGKLTPAQLAQALAEQHGVPYTTLPPLATAVLEAVPLDFQRAHRLVPIRVEGEVLSIAMADLADTDAVRALQETWPQVKVFVAAGDEIDALHSALFGEFPGAPPVELPDVAPHIAAARGPAPSADDLFGSLDMDGEPAARPMASASGLFGDLDLDGAGAPGASPSGQFDLSSLDEPAAPTAPLGMFDLSVDDAGTAPSPSGMFELPVDEPPAPSGPSGLFELTRSLEADENGDTSGEVLELTTEVQVPEDEPAGAEEEELFFEARLSAPSPEPVAPPPVVTPIAPVAAPVSAAPPVSGSSVLEQLFISPDEPVSELVALPPVAASAVKPVAAKASDVKPPPPKPEAKPVVERAALEPKASPASKPPRASPGAKVAPARAAPDAKKPALEPRPLDVKPADGKSPAAKPHETKSHDAKPLDAKPGVVKPVDVKPAPPRAAERKGSAPEEPKHAAPVAGQVEPPKAHDPPKPAPKKAEAALDLPDWLRGDAAPVDAPVDEGTDLWTGELETLAPSKLITGVARALIRKGILTEQDVLEALERKKS